MAGRLEGKKTLITAAGQGIGRSTVLAFAREGAHVLATDINPDSLDLLKKEFLESATNIETCVLDVNNLQAIQQLAKENGVFVVLFNCATGLKYPMPEVTNKVNKNNSIDYNQFI